MQKRRILTVVRPAEGGIKAHVLNLLRHLQSDFHFTVACPPEQVADFQGTGCEVIAVSLVGRLHPYYDIQSARQLCRMLCSHKYSLLHAHGFKVALLSRPVSRYCKVPCLVTIHGDLAHGGTAKYRLVYRKAERALSGWAEGYVTVSHWLAELLIADFRVPAERIVIIPNGILLNTGESFSLGELPFTAEVPLVGTVARLAPQKGVEHFLLAAKELAHIFPELRFMVVGDGPLRMRLERLCGELGIVDKVYFAGFRQDVPAILQRLHLFVQSSVSEGQGITVLEAMAAGCPVVASAAGGLKELIKDGETGLLVQPGNPHALAQAVAQLLRNKQLRQQITVKARIFATKYDLAEMITKTREVYLRILEGRWPA
ncbi:MAG: glycosyltransferase family 4 protein [Firmicutes bacterium]|nr:glycosyltransferase family 4 protein [Dethiobacter sp.]MBS3899508.1 glycosyltransferase family 4 protein [Dethiobacter sp.]MCL4463343.1 glycosyltransferase family 4 protein [Bacillota bacterium]MCL5992784.1 glycosyltransferase family 4 protein [Bacillota bacterium]